MLFRRNKPTPVALPVALIAPVSDQDTAQPQQYTLNAFARTPKTLKEVFSISAKLPIDSTTKPKPTGPTKKSTIPTPVRSQQPQRGPSSRKTGHATIYTDATDEHAAFESDAFAVHMPTTRLPIIDRPISPKKPSPVAQAAAFRTYQEKAHQVRARNHSTGVRVPSKIVSYDYASSKIVSRDAAQAEKFNEPPSPLQPAGSFPLSPPILQTGWEHPQVVNRMHTQSRSLNEPRRVYTLSKPLNSIDNAVSPETQGGASRSTPSPTQPPPIRIRITPRIIIPKVQNSQMGSKESPHRRSPTISPPTSRSTSPHKSMPNFTRHNSVEGDSLFGYQVKDRTATTAGAKASSGSDNEKDKDQEREREQKQKREHEQEMEKKEKEKKEMEKKAMEKKREMEKEIERRKEKLKEEAKEKVKEKMKEKESVKTPKKLEKPKKAEKEEKAEKAEKIGSAGNTSPKRTMGSRWPWMRPAGPRVDKPAPAPTPEPTSNVTPKTMPSSNAPRLSAYISPFERHATPPAPTSPRNPTVSRPPASRKTASAAPPAPAPQGKFETGVAQIKGLALILCKIGFILYAIVALWYVLDTAREAIHAIGAPFRFIGLLGGWAWLGVLWLINIGVNLWEQWGFKLALKGGWMWRVR